MCDDLDLPISLLADGNCVAQVTHSVVDLDLVVEKLLEGSDVKDLI